jgi:hypothetical protein
MTGRLEDCLGYFVALNVVGEIGGGTKMEVSSLVAVVFLLFEEWSKQKIFMIISDHIQSLSLFLLLLHHVGQRISCTAQE